jgi:hypothetical protein
MMTAPTASESATSLESNDDLTSPIVSQTDDSSNLEPVVPAPVTAPVTSAADKPDPGSNLINGDVMNSTAEEPNRDSTKPDNSVVSNLSENVNAVNTACLPPSASSQPAPNNDPQHLDSSNLGTQRSPSAESPQSHAPPISKRSSRVPAKKGDDETKIWTYDAGKYLEGRLQEFGGGELAKAFVEYEKNLGNPVNKVSIYDAHILQN